MAFVTARRLAERAEQRLLELEACPTMRPPWAPPWTHGRVSGWRHTACGLVVVSARDFQVWDWLSRKHTFVIRAVAFTHDPRGDDDPAVAAERAALLAVRNALAAAEPRPLRSTEDFEACPVCAQAKSLRRVVELGCGNGHLLCADCAFALVRPEGQNRACPFCRARFFCVTPAAPRCAPML